MSEIKGNLPANYKTIRGGVGREVFLFGEKGALETDIGVIGGVEVTEEYLQVSGGVVEYVPELQGKSYGENNTGIVYPNWIKEFKTAFTVNGLVTGLLQEGADIMDITSSFVKVKEFIETEL